MKNPSTANAIEGGTRLFDFLFQTFEELRMKELVNCDTQTIAKFLNRGYSCTVITSTDDIIHGRLRNTTYYFENLQAMLTLIKAGYGIGIFPEMPSTDAALVYVPLNRDHSLSYGVFYKDTSKNPVLKRFLSLINMK